MTSNLGFDNGHPYLEMGVFEGSFLFDGVRVIAVDQYISAANLVTVERSVDGGVTWEPVSETALRSLATVSDPESLSNGATLYRASGTATATGAVSPATECEVYADSGHIWLSGGVGFTDAARLPFNPQISLRPGRDTATVYYEGRSKPVAYKGDQSSLAVDVAGTVFVDDIPAHASALVDDMVRVAQLPEAVHMLRTPDGKRYYGSVPEIPLPRERFKRWGYSFSLTETERG